MSDPKTLQDAIENLASKKHLISDAAIQARQNTLSQQGALDKNQAVLNEFNQSIKMLMSVFKQSNFDQFLLLLSKPGRLMTLQLLMGLVRGIGFTLGIVVLSAIALYVVKIVHPTTIATLLTLLPR